MTKICQNCQYTVPTKEEEREPPGIAEDCPKCGGIGTVVDEAQELDEGAEETDAE